jgi:hypothetical protein
MNAKKEIEKEMLQYRVRADFTERTCNTIEASLEHLYQMGYDEGVKEEIGQAKYWQNEWVKLNNELYKEQQKSNLLKSKKNG